MEIGKRLKERIQEMGLSTRQFQHRVAEAAPTTARGISYASVYEYVEGRADPPLSFLTVAAQVLYVRPSWLAFGDEPMRQDPQLSIPQRLAGPAAEALLAQLVQQLGWAQPMGSAEPTKAEAARLSVELLWPINLLNALYPTGASGKVHETFLLGYLAAVLAVAPLPGEGRPIPEVIKELRSIRGKRRS